MKVYIVLYRDSSVEEVYGFACQADGFDHAEEQCLDAIGVNDKILLVHEGDSVVYKGATYTKN